MIHLVYVSSAIREMSEEDLLHLLEQSRNRNIRQIVTGMLLYAGGNFFQVLEGDIKDVEDIYKAIETDERNKGNIVLLKETIKERTFQDWSMGFKHLTDQDSEAEGYTDFLNSSIEPEEFANKQNIVLMLLYQFKAGNRYNQ